MKLVRTTHISPKVEGRGGEGRRGKGIQASFPPYKSKWKGGEKDSG